MSFEILTVDEVISKLKGRKYKYSQVHHTWKPDHSNFDGKNHLKIQQGMYNSHVHDRGWDNIGQHLSLFPDGKFVTGRPFNQTPAGITGYNTGAFMVEMVGNFDKGHDKLEGKQLDAMLKLQKYLITECGATIMFHHEHAAKSCPGTGIDKETFVKQVKSYGTKPKPAAKPKPKQVTKEITSLVDYLKAHNMPSDFMDRVHLARKHGMAVYNGTADQNIKLLAILKSKK